MNLLRALLAVSSLTLVSRILGYVRDFFIARAFGAGLATDSFFVAFRIPNLLRRLFAAAVFFARYFDPPIVALAWAVFAGGVLQLAFQVPFLVRLELLPRWRLDLSHPGVRRVLKIMAPATFGVSVAQISLLINTIF